MEGASVCSTAEVSLVSLTGSVVAVGLSTIFSGDFAEDARLPEVARLGFRNKPPSLEEDFLPSPSVVSDSDATSGLFSFLDPRLLKKEERRLGLVVSGEAAVPVGSEVVGATASVLGAAAALGVDVVSLDRGASDCVDFTGSSS